LAPARIFLFGGLILLAGSVAGSGAAYARAPVLVPSPILVPPDDREAVVDEEEPEDEESEKTARVDLSLRGDYQRVDGLVLGLEQDFQSRNDPGAHIRLAEAYAFHRERWLYEAVFEHALLPREFLLLGAGIFRQTRPFDGLDDRIVGDGENALAALLVKEDFRDYYEEEGGEVYLRLHLVPGNTLHAGYLLSSHDPIGNNTRSSLTRWGEDFRPNPAAEAGELRAVRLRFEHDTRRDQRPSGSTDWHRIEWERAGAGLGGDFDYARLIADLRHYMKLSPGQTIAGRVLYGNTLSGQVPLQKEFALGGISTLRAHEYKEFTGDQVLLANLEYRLDISKDFNVLTFVDVGAAARGEGRIDDQRFALDGGFGAGTRNGRAVVTVARDLHRADSPFKVSFRLGPAF
jgi:outer membrane protein assembly factor BamA